eukprot:2877444-Prymnesium_polylepis.1
MVEPVGAAAQDADARALCRRDGRRLRLCGRRRRVCHHAAHRRAVDKDGGAVGRVARRRLVGPPRHPDTDDDEADGVVRPARGRAGAQPKDRCRHLAAAGQHEVTPGECPLQLGRGGRRDGGLFACAAGGGLFGHSWRGAGPCVRRALELPAHCLHERGLCRRRSAPRQRRG